MKLAQSLIAGILVLSASWAQAQVVSQQEIIERLSLRIDPNYFSYKNQLLGIQDEMDATWRYQKEDPRLKAYYEQRRRELTSEAADVREKIKHIHQEAGSQSQNVEISNKAYEEILAEKKVAQTQNRAFKNSIFDPANEVVKNTPEPVGRINLSARQQAQVARATQAYHELLRTFPGASLETVFDRLRVLSGGEVPGAANANELRNNYLRMSQLSQQMKTASSPAALSSMAKELESLSAPLVDVVKKYRYFLDATNSKIVFIARGATIQSGNNDIILDESGKVTSFLKNGAKKIPGKNIRAALFKAGLSALVISETVLADEVPTATSSNHVPDLHSKDWANAVNVGQ